MSSFDVFLPDLLPVNFGNLLIHKDFFALKTIREPTDLTIGSRGRSLFINCDTFAITMAIKRISVGALKIGMFVVGFDRPWAENPFLQQFQIRT
ncbi:MAG: DUF3391 domain-containing protein, partial [Nitrospiraceae bacterium]